MSCLGSGAGVASTSTRGRRAGRWPTSSSVSTNGEPQSGRVGMSAGSSGCLIRGRTCCRPAKTRRRGRGSRDLAPGRMSDEACRARTSLTLLSRVRAVPAVSPVSGTACKRRRGCPSRTPRRRPPSPPGGGPRSRCPDSRGAQARKGIGEQLGLTGHRPALACVHAVPFACVGTTCP